MDSDRPVTISAAPSFTSKWLVPHLRHLHEMHPDIDIRIDTAIEVVDLAHSDIDIGSGLAEVPIRACRSTCSYLKKFIPCAAQT